MNQCQHRTDLDRFLSFIQFSPDGCWIWSGNRREGYAGFTVGGRRVGGHRWAYEEWVGTIPAGLHIDHLCQNRACVNPAHLEPVTNAENRRRTIARQTHCSRGHEWNEANTYIRADGTGKACRACRLISHHKYMQRRREAA